MEAFYINKIKIHWMNIISIIDGKSITDKSERENIATDRCYKHLKLELQSLLRKWPRWTML